MHHLLLNPFVKQLNLLVLVVQIWEKQVTTNGVSHIDISPRQMTRTRFYNFQPWNMINNAHQLEPQKSKPPASYN